MWCLTRSKEPQMANDFEVFRYYDLKIRIRNGKLFKVLSTTYCDGVQKNEFQIKIEKYLMLDEQSKNKIKIKAKKHLPHLEQKFKKIKINYNENLQIFSYQKNNTK